MIAKSAAHAQVEELARDFVDKGRFKTMAEARNYVFETRPEMAAEVRAQALTPTVEKRAPLSGARAEVEKAARGLVNSGEFESMQLARAHIYETTPQLAEQVRKEATA
jgi:hypothetical protein